MSSPKNKITNEQKCSVIKKNTLKWLGHIQLHGANRLASRESSWFWIPSMIILLILASSLLYQMIIRYQSNPTYMLHVDSVQTELAFPSVIIYPGVNFRAYKKDEFLSNIEYPRDLNKSYVRKILPQLAVLFSPEVRYNMSDLITLESLLEYNNMDVETAGRLLTENCEDILIRCAWMNEIRNCSDLFRMYLTRDGFCCVFQGRSLRREMQENIHIEVKKPYIYTDKFGFNSGLRLAINQTQKPSNIDLSYKWIALQAAQRFVDPTLNGTALSPGIEQWVAYTTQSVYITDTARQLGALLRRCTLSGENLKYFPSYRRYVFNTLEWNTRKYCTLECEMARTIRQCGCVRVTHPRPRGVPYCTARRLPCALRRSENANSCDCPHTCDVNTASTTITNFVLDANVPSVDKFYRGLDFKNLTIVRAFIDKYKKRSKQRASYYSFLDLFSQMGGMFNLFFGCSVLTMLGLLQLIWKIAVSLWTRPTKEKATENVEDINQSDLDIT